MKTMKKPLLIALIMLWAGLMSYGQLLKPTVSDIASGLKNHKFVLVIKANEKFNKPERVVMNDWSPSDETFDPDKIDTYPKWSFDNFEIYGRDGKVTRTLIIKNETTGKYFSYPSGHGPTMLTKKEFDAIFAKDDQGKYKNSVTKMYRYIFKPQVKGNYIQLGIPNKEGKNLVVTPAHWNTRQFKLVLVK